MQAGHLQAAERADASQVTGWLCQAVAHLCNNHVQSQGHLNVLGCLMQGGPQMLCCSRFVLPRR